MIGETFSHFRITAKLGEGGMGEVYRAEDTRLGREVAVKVLRETLAGGPERLARFQREARVLAALDHPNIAAVYGLEEAGGRQLLVMQLVEGETLAERLERGPIPGAEALGMALQIAVALEAAHERGIVHRDLKPANVKLAPDGSVKVLDFGLAKALEEERQGGDPASSPTLSAAATQAGIILGTAAYMSPEQAVGSAADRRSDIWSFGVVLTEMLTGRRLFTGETVSHTLAAVLKEEPDWEELPASVPAPVRELLARCLRKEPQRRLQAIGDARVVLEEVLADPEAFAPRPRAAGEVVAQAPWRRRLLWAAAGAAAAGLAAAAGFLWPRPAPLEAPVRLSVELGGERGLLRGYGSSVVLSPAGDRLAYVTGDIDATQLHLRSLDRWASTELVAASGADQPYHPFFSPDGSWLGFVTRTGLKKVPVSGGAAITLAPVNLSRGASWGPGETVVFAPDPGSGLFRVAAAGGEPEALTQLDEEKGEATHRWPQVLPGGGAVLFTSHTRATGGFDDANLEVLDLGTGERKVVHRGGSYGRYAPSGHLVYVNDGTLFAVPFDLGRLEVSGSPAPVAQGVSASPVTGGAQFDFSADGKLVYATGTGGVPVHSAVWVDREGKASPLWEEEQAYRNPRLSPDGTRLAVEIESGGNTDVWVYDLERDVPTRLTFGEAYDGEPVWSPDGREIYFASQRGGGALNLYRKAADGSGEAERLTESDRSQWPESVSPDGQLLAYVEQGAETNLDLWLLPPEGGGEPEPFLATSFVEATPAFSPDGRWIAYLSNESGSAEVYVRSAAGRGRWQVSSGGGIAPVWSRDGRELFYRNLQGGVSAVAVEAGGGAFRSGRPRVLFEGPFVLAAGDSYYDLHPDGRRFVMFRGREEAGAGEAEHLKVVLGWFGELRRTVGGPSR